MDRCTDRERRMPDARHRVWEDKMSWGEQKRNPKVVQSCMFVIEKKGHETDCSGRDCPLANPPDETPETQFVVLQPTNQPTNPYTILISVDWQDDQSIENTHTHTHTHTLLVPQTCLDHDSKKNQQTTTITTITILASQYYVHDERKKASAGASVVGFKYDR